MICPTSSQPRFHKRAVQLAKCKTVKALAFSRGLYEESCFGPEIEFFTLGKIQDGNYSKRLITLFKAIFTIRKVARKSKKVMYYAFSLDCLIIAKLAGLTSGFYEIGDLRISHKSNWLFSKLEKYLLLSTNGVIITSEYFYEGYFKNKKIERDFFHVIENKLSYDYFNGRRPKQETLFPTQKIRIGVVGLLRYEKPLTMLIKFVNKHPDKFSLDCYGDGTCKELFIKHSSKSICYHGSFKYPEQIMPIYRSIDISFVVYDSSSPNVKLALPNKLYESAFFGVPLICASDTALESNVERMRIGTGISIESQDIFEQGMLSILSIDTLREYRENCFNVEEKDLIDHGHLVVEKLFR